MELSLFTVIIIFLFLPSYPFFLSAQKKSWPGQNSLLFFFSFKDIYSFLRLLERRKTAQVATNLLLSTSINCSKLLLIHFYFKFSRFSLILGEREEKSRVFFKTVNKLDWLKSNLKSQILIARELCNLCRFFETRLAVCVTFSFRFFPCFSALTLLILRQIVGLMVRRQWLIKYWSKSIIFLT